jgi:hypothetical protein
VLSMQQKHAAQKRPTSASPKQPEAAKNRGNRPNVPGDESSKRPAGSERDARSPHDRDGNEERARRSRAGA